MTIWTKNNKDFKLSEKNGKIQERWYQDVVLTLVLAPLSWVWDINFYIHCKKGPIPRQQEGQVGPSVQSHKNKLKFFTCAWVLESHLYKMLISVNINSLSAPFLAKCFYQKHLQLLFKYLKKLLNFLGVWNLKNI